MKLDFEGSTVHVSTGGNPPEAAPNQPLAVLVHGAGMDSSVWSLQTRFLAHRGITVLAVDLPGHGQSGGQALISIEEMAQWLTRFIRFWQDQQAIDQPIHLVGHSMGALIALAKAELLSKDAMKLASLSMLGVASSMPVHPELLQAADRDLALAAALMAGWAIAPGSKLGRHPNPGSSMVGVVRALIEKSKQGVLASDLAACAAYQGAMTAAANIDCPVLLVAGETDRMTPLKAAVELSEKIARPDTELVALEGAGHMMMLELDEQVRSLLFGQLKGGSNS